MLVSMISDTRGPSSAARYARGPSATARPYFLGAHSAPKTFLGPKYGCRVFRIFLNFHIFDTWGGRGVHRSKEISLFMPLKYQKNVNMKISEMGM